MKIAAIGAAGRAGTRIVTVALRRGHQITAVVRNPNSTKKLTSKVKVVIGEGGPC